MQSFDELDEELEDGMSTTLEVRAKKKLEPRSEVVLSSRDMAALKELKANPRPVTAESKAAIAEYSGPSGKANRPPAADGYQAAPRAG